jgi:hypothetical protein
VLSCLSELTEHVSLHGVRKPASSSSIDTVKCTPTPSKLVYSLLADVIDWHASLEKEGSLEDGGAVYKDGGKVSGIFTYDHLPNIIFTVALKSNK